MYLHEFLEKFYLFFIQLKSNDKNRILKENSFDVVASLLIRRRNKKRIQKF